MHLDHWALVHIIIQMLLKKGTFKIDIWYLEGCILDIFMFWFFPCRKRVASETDMWFYIFLQSVEVYITLYFWFILIGRWRRSLTVDTKLADGWTKCDTIDYTCCAPSRRILRSILTLPMRAPKQLLAEVQMNIHFNRQIYVSSSRVG